MAKHKFSKSRKGKNSGAKQSKQSKSGDANAPWIQDLKNEKFEEYYLAQGLMDRDEWLQFMEFIRKPLPTTFRLSGSRQLSHDLNKIIQETYVPHLSDVVFEGVKLQPPTQIPWYPEGLAWHLDVPKSALRKSPEFKRFHNFLVYETDVGNVSRQEAVSMIPPLLLNVASHHIVLDMCAAPGSKTAQLLEALHSTTPSQDKIPSGVVIANDSDFKRTHLLVHQSSRLPSPSFMVTNLDASSYPNIFMDSHGRQALKFDRILCDVPCSGDGTLRKNINIWRTWQSMDGNGLHPLQLRILTRAMNLLKPDGRIVYSTCSLNPIENEAVIAAALQSHPEFEVVDVSSELPSLIRKPGLDTWHPVYSKELDHFSSYEEYVSHCKNHNQPLKLAATHWPPQNAKELNLHRCLRIYPHLQDMGGFFVAVLQLKSSLSLENESSNSTEAPNLMKRVGSPNPDSRESEVKRPKINSKSAGEPESVTGLQRNTPQINQNDSGRFKEAPYTFLDLDHPQLKELSNRLQLSSSFPFSNLFVRNPEGAGADISIRSIYLCNDVVKSLIEANNYTKIRLVSAGTKVFTRQEGGENKQNPDNVSSARQQFRILADAVSTLLPYFSRSTIYSGTKDDLKRLLESYHPLLNDFGESLCSQLVAKENGNLLIEFAPFAEDDGVLQHPLILPLWKANASVSLMMDKKSKSALSLRVFSKDITIFGKEVHEKYMATQKRREEAVANGKTKDESDQDDEMGENEDLN